MNCESFNNLLLRLFFMAAYEILQWECDRIFWETELFSKKCQLKKEHYFLYCDCVEKDTVDAVQNLYVET